VILIGIGSNLAHPPFASPHATVVAALAALPAATETRMLACSSWYLTEPIPKSDQPWFVNAVASVASDLPAQALLDQMLRLEMRFGRTSGPRNAARTLDLDLLDYDSYRCDTATLVLPHPRLHQRLFVLEPLREIAPGWRHPCSGLGVAELIERLPPGQRVTRLDE
jgi:2-amino-4-hydroxy-6-hydroxymethyldihydropteridine diphosphokinase